MNDTTPRLARLLKDIGLTYIGQGWVLGGRFFSTLEEAEAEIVRLCEAAGVQQDDLGTPELIAKVEAAKHEVFASQAARYAEIARRMAFHQVLDLEDVRFEANADKVDIQTEGCGESIRTVKEAEDVIALLSAWVDFKRA